MYAENTVATLSVMKFTANILLLMRATPASLNFTLRKLLSVTVYLNGLELEDGESDS